MLCLACLGISNCSSHVILFWLKSLDKMHDNAFDFVSGFVVPWLLRDPDLG